MKTIYTLALLLMTLVSQAQNLSSEELFKIEGRIDLVNTVDFNGDGSPELFYRQTFEDSSHIVLVSGILDSVPNFISLGELDSVEIMSVLFNDFNYDSFTDILIISESDSGIVSFLYKNEGGFSFSLIEQTVFEFKAKNWIDLNNDTRQDLIGSNDSSIILIDLLNSGETELLSREGLSDFWVFDLNNDSRQDILVYDSLDRSLLLYLNQSQFPETDFEFIDILMSNIDITNLITVDLDSNSYSDLVITGFRDSVVNQILFNDSLVFEMDESSFFDSNIYQVSSGDLDNDGANDLVWLSDSLLYLLNSDNDLIEFSDSFQLSGFSPIDVNTDSLLEVVYWQITGDSSSVGLFFETDSIINAPPAPPVVDLILPIADSVLFSWTPSVDDKTDSASITYDLFLGIIEDSTSIFAANANSETGSRFLFESGRLQYNNSYTFHDLLPGTYSYCLTATDNSNISSGCNGGCLSLFKLNEDSTIRVCSGESLQLIANPELTSVSWFSQNNGPIGSGSSILYIVNEFDIVYYQGSSDSVCSFVESFIIDVFEFDLIDTLNVCQGEFVDIDFGSLGVESLTFLNLPSDSLINPILNPQVSQFLSVSVVDSNGCAFQDSIFLEVFEPPLVRVMEDFLVCPDETIQVETNIVGVEERLRFEWFPEENLSSSTIADPFVLIDQSVQLILVVTDTISGCMNSDTLNIGILPEEQCTIFNPDVFVPSLFSPNGDGSNDQFLLYGSDFEEVELSIFNRSGELIYRSNDIVQLTTSGWDGRFNGSDQPQGTYLWTVSGTFQDGSPILFQGERRGTFRLIR
ncbi:MAG: gliding motility-associated C-terminal domain-containing protein [Bacteroidota bacterium]